MIFYFFLGYFIIIYQLASIYKIDLKSVELRIKNNSRIYMYLSMKFFMGCISLDLDKKEQ